jgi:hypothetical protein
LLFLALAAGLETLLKFVGHSLPLDPLVIVITQASLQAGLVL